MTSLRNHVPDPRRLVDGLDQPTRLPGAGRWWWLVPLGTLLAGLTAVLIADRLTR